MNAEPWPKKIRVSPDMAWLIGCMSRAETIGEFAEFHMLTPEIASFLLDRNDGNRPLIRRHIDTIAEALRRATGC